MYTSFTLVTVVISSQDSGRCLSKNCLVGTTKSSPDFAVAEKRFEKAFLAIIFVYKSMKPCHYTVILYKIFHKSGITCRFYPIR